MNGTNRNRENEAYLVGELLDIRQSYRGLESLDSVIGEIMESLVASFRRKRGSFNCIF